MRFNPSYTTTIYFTLHAFLCEVIWNLLRGVSSNISEDRGNTIERRPAFISCIMVTILIGLAGLLLLPRVRNR
ncbi:hypothetical protein EV424DRAFT_1439180 [Suillus variegatus]|nr:hypothetical protein EV424DRAFT_1439180 [Suillus variegatus]